MSGIEIIGIVLAAIPVIQAALKKCEETASTFSKSQKEFRTVNRSLKVEVAILKNNLQELLNDTELDDQLKLELIDDVSGTRWSDINVQNALKNRLTNSFEPYLETIRSMNDNLLEFTQLLPLGPQVPSEADSSFRELCKRFSFTRKKSTCMALIQEMHDGNLALARLTEHMSSSNLAQLSRRKRVPRSSQIPNFERLRERATAIFHTLQDRLGTSCKASHKVSLNLKELDEALTNPKEGVPSREFIFQLIVHHGPLSSTQAPPTWRLEEAEIRSLNVTIIDNVMSTSSAMSTAKQSETSKTKKSVKWAKQPTSSPPSAAIGPPSQQATGEEIRDLCASIEKLRTANCDACLGYMFDSAKQRHGVYRPKKLLLDPTSSSALPLSMLLATRKTRQGRSFTRADSRRLALSLSYGILRLHGTPWLKDQWRTDDIVLFEQNTKIAADQPFASADLLGVTATITGIGTKQSSNPAIRSPTVFALAIVLIELCMRKPLQELQAPGDLNPDGTKHISTDYFTALRLLPRIEEKAGTKYADAVKRCIKLGCDLDYANPTLEDEAFRRAVYEDVVAVLQEDVAFSWS